MRDKSIGIVFFHDIGMNRYLVKNNAVCWNKESYPADIFIPDEDDSFLKNYAFGMRLNINKFPHKDIRISLKLFAYILWIYKLTRQKKYKCFIGIGTFGLIIAYPLAKILKVPIVYHCLELEFMMEEKPFFEKVFRYIEKKLVKNVQLIIMPGESRAEIYAKNNNVPPGKFVIVPNSQIITENKHLNKTDYLKQKLSLAADKKIVLYTGTIEEWNMLDDIINSIKYWPQKYVFVVHGWSRSGYIDKLQKLSEKYEGRVYFTTDLLEEEKYEEMMLSADISIAFYPSKDENGFNIGLSSGKIFQYLKCGLPVICSNLPDLVSLINGNNCGICVDEKNGTEIATAIKTILGKQEVFSENAKKCFIKYEFRKYYNDVIKYIENTNEK